MWGPCSEKIVGSTNRIKMKGQMTVFCAIFVTKYTQGLGYVEDESDTLYKNEEIFSCLHTINLCLQ